MPLFRLSSQGDLCVAEAGIILEAVVVCLVLHDGVGREVQNASKSVSDSRCRHLIAGRLIPYRQDVFLEANRDHHPTDLLSHHELFSQHGQNNVLPEPAGQTFPQPDDPLPSVLISFILPHGFDSLFKQVEVRVASQISRSHQVTVEFPELLHRCDRADLSDVLFITLCVGGPGRSPPRIPQGIVILERMFPYCRTHRLASIVVDGAVFLPVTDRLILILWVVIFQMFKLIHLSVEQSSSQRSEPHDNKES